MTCWWQGRCRGASSRQTLWMRRRSSRAPSNTCADYHALHHIQAEASCQMLRCCLTHMPHWCQATASQRAVCLSGGASELGPHRRPRWWCTEWHCWGHRCRGSRWQCGPSAALPPAWACGCCSARCSCHNIPAVHKDLFCTHTRCCPPANGKCFVGQPLRGLDLLDSGFHQDLRSDGSETAFHAFEPWCPTQAVHAAGRSGAGS